MNYNVMVVDDDAAGRDLLVLHLTKNLLRAVGAAGGEQCLEHFRNGFSGVVLMDVRMPGLDGWKTIKEIIKQGYTEKAIIILLTGVKGARNDNLEDYEKYVAEYIPKPVDLEQVVKAVKNYLRYF